MAKKTKSFVVNHKLIWVRLRLLHEKLQTKTKSHIFYFHIPNNWADPLAVLQQDVQNNQPTTSTWLWKAPTGSSLLLVLGAVGPVHGCEQAAVIQQSNSSKRHHTVSERTDKQLMCEVRLQPVTHQRGTKNSNILRK